MRGRGVSSFLESVLLLRNPLPPNEDNKEVDEEEVLSHERSNPTNVFDQVNHFFHSVALSTNMLTFVLDLVFPRRSLTGVEGQWMTSHERKLLEPNPIREDQSQLRERGLRYLDTLFASAYYHDCPLLKKAIHTFKYKMIPELCTELVEMMTACSPPIDPSAMPVLCPVPLHWRRRFRRGFNQAELLCDGLHLWKGLPTTSLLKRVHATGHQAHRNRQQRLAAMRDVFRMVDCDVVPSHVILIDDLSTTGATFDACAKVLKEAGVKKVEGWVVAKG